MISHRLPNNKKENKYFKNENNSEINTKQSLVYINIKKKEKDYIDSTDITQILETKSS